MPLSLRISVVIPSHNRPELLVEALQSVMQQTADAWEAIVVDDGSTPPVYLGALAEDLGEKLRILRHADPKGGPDAKNTGAQAARGDVIAFLDDDDLYAPEYLERALHVLDHYPHVDVVFMGVSWFGDNAKWGEEAYRQAMKKILQEADGAETEPGVILFGDALVGALLNRVPMAFQRPVVRRPAFESIGGYREGCLLWDCDWATRAALQVPTALLTEGLYRQRVDNQGFSSKRERQLEHLMSAVEIRDRLLKKMATQQQYKHKAGLFREAAAKGWFDLAYYYHVSGRPGKALAAWWQSQKRLVKAGRTKLLIRLLLSVLWWGRGQVQRPRA
jgi:glycosyltransferase involved in cell wall biosynthesis